MGLGDGTVTPGLDHALLKPGLRSFESLAMGIVEFSLSVDPRDDSLWLAAHHLVTGQTERTRMATMAELESACSLPFHDKAMIMLAEVGVWL